jgi:hypothetical protein
MLLPQIENLRAKTNSTGPVVLLLEGQSIRVSEYVVAFAGSETILLIRLVPHSPHLSQSLDLRMFGLFK